ncbi:hypothetical protein [Dokdonella soli]|uniref:DUF3619 family protein n=1 Tax=Dokdonella soli TaxID=529810 RepID=A0ABP3TUU2_9GAMM
MKDMSLSSLYRRLVSARPQPDVDAADLVAVVSADEGSGELSARHRDAVVEKLAASPQHADLARMLRALKPASEALATSMNEHRHGAHPLRAREQQRLAAGARRGHVHRLRWAAGLAACLAVALGVFAWHHEDGQHLMTAGTARTAPLPDRIFTSSDRIFASSSGEAGHGESARHGGGDEVFRGRFSAGG